MDIILLQKAILFYYRKKNPFFLILKCNVNNVGYRNAEQILFQQRKTNVAITGQKSKDRIKRYKIKKNKHKIQRLIKYR